MTATAASLRPQCSSCGELGEVFFAGLSDRLFGAGGVWQVRRCINRRCRQLWLDPSPSDQELAAAYSRYYTHEAEPADASTWLHRTLAVAKRGLWARRFGYVDSADGFAGRFAGFLLALAPVRSREAEAEVRFLPRVPGGRLLDVGCGSGGWLEQMAALGWNVEGVDFDPQAVAVAVARGLCVRHGSIDGQGYAPQTFDAITLNHVIEHVPTPEATVEECVRLLKPGGRLVIMTPCSTSLSLRVFGRNWRGLEPPRHLQVFSPASMRRLLAAAGLRAIDIRPFVVTSVVAESLRLQLGRPAGGSLGERVAVGAFKTVETLLIAVNPNLGDCLIALATK